MTEYLKNNVQLQILAVFSGGPLLIWAAAGDPGRTPLKESLSVLTILAFGLMIGLFYLARPNRAAVRKIGAAKLLRWHKLIGYAAVPVLLVHPVLLVVPRYFEAGLAPGEAFRTIVTTTSSSGILFGLGAWCLMLLLGLSALLRKQLPLTYPTWRIVHGVLALLCVVSAALHALDLGRHADSAMAVFVVLLSAGGIYLLLKSYAAKEQPEGEKR
ncbi:hypothetical protein DESUT3_33770 [Desulfuromonas versatilis]|uniref:Ferric oxidoreductase domain-containing protein n=1 Tax=Desulfuromonas versatilis TaxID=2802975 RepID=A0ABM8HWJ9_9BACT|nr:ferric reductase-like transmembrane domain-containing protein [Desulfuromonas versatilis]BCR06308.1 hypothetical protein DESUT3_33770 [Desulfuromonas versatilis]